MDDPHNISLTDNQRHWLDHLRACEASGKGIAAYAAEQGLDVKAMYTGKKTLVKKGILPRSRISHATRFEQVQIIESSTESEWRIALPNGSIVEFSASFDEHVLGKVLRAAAQA